MFGSGQAQILPRLPVRASRGRRATLSPLRYSDYMITVNTNYRPSDPQDGEARLQALELACLAVFDNDAAVKSFLMTKPGAPRGGQITEIRAAIRGEVGGRLRGGRVHTHVVLCVDHTTRLTTTRESVSRLRRLLFSTGLIDFAPTLWIRFRLLSNDYERTRHYLNKDDPHRPGRSLSASERISVYKV